MVCFQTFVASSLLNAAFLQGRISSFRPDTDIWCVHLSGMCGREKHESGTIEECSY